MLRRIWILVLSLFILTLSLVYFLLYWFKFNFLYESSWLLVQKVLPPTLRVAAGVLVFNAAYLLYGPYLSRWFVDASSKWLKVTVVIAIGLRLLHIVLVPTQPVSDFQFYNDRAINVLTYGTYGFEYSPTATFPPGTALFFAVIYGISRSTNIFLPKVVQAILGALGIVMVYRITLICFDNIKVANIAAMLLAFMPSHIAFTSILASENIFTFTNLVFLWLLSLPSCSNRAYFIIGVLIGLSALIRPVGLLMPVFPVLTLLVRKTKHHINLKQLVQCTFICLLGFWLLLIPWGFRNYVHYGRFAVTSSSGGIDLWMGNNEQATGRWIDMSQLIHAGLNNEYTDRQDVFELDSLYAKQGLQFISKHPIQFLKLALRKIIILYSGDTEAIHWSMTGNGVIVQEKLRNDFHNLSELLVALFDGYFYIIVGLFLLGLPLIAKEVFSGAKPYAIVLLAYIAYFTLIHSIFISGQRFHFTIVPILIIFSAYTLARTPFFKSVQS